MKQLNLGAGPGVAVREYPTDSDPADYVLFVGRNAVGVIEAKRDSAGENIMSPSLFANWCIWIFLSLVIISGTSVYRLSSGKVIPIKLLEGQKANVSLFRVFPSSFNFHIWIPKGDNPKKFGRCDYGKDSKEFLCEELSPRILTKVVLNGQTEVYETLPVSGIGAKSTTHYTIPFVEDGNPYLFHRPEKHQIKVLTSFKNEVLFTISDVEKQLKGKMIEIYIEGAIPFKFEPKGGYHLFWWFHFWPLYMLFLVIYFLILLFKTLRLRKETIIKT